MECGNEIQSAAVGLPSPLLRAGFGDLPSSKYNFSVNDGYDARSPIFLRCYDL